MNIISYHFLPRKYGRDILLDIARIETLENFILDSTPHQISFYEIYTFRSVDCNKFSAFPTT